MSKRTLALFLLLAFLTALLAGCAQASSSSSRDIPIEQALADWQSKVAVILDVRTPGEYAEGHIPGAKLIPLDQLSSRLEEVPREGKVYIICRSGNRSAQALNLLQNKGFTNVYNVLHGMNAWRGPVEK